MKRNSLRDFSREELSDLCVGSDDARGVAGQLSVEELCWTEEVVGLGQIVDAGEGGGGADTRSSPVSYTHLTLPTKA